MYLITGASRGIGYECALALLEQTDAPVMITGRSQAGLEHARASVAAQQRDRLLLHRCDQAQRDDVESLTALLSDPATRLDGAILGVGVNPMYSVGPQRLHAVSAAIVEATICTNCTHAVLLSAAILARFRRQRGGALVWIGSQAYKAGLPGGALYGATKAFLSGLAVAAQHEYGRTNVRVHLLNPGLVRTQRTERVIDGFAERHGIAVQTAPWVAKQIVTMLLSGPADRVEVDL